MRLGSVCIHLCGLTVAIGSTQVQASLHPSSEAPMSFRIGIPIAASIQPPLRRSHDRTALPPYRFIRSPRSRRAASAYQHHLLTGSRASPIVKHKQPFALAARNFLHPLQTQASESPATKQSHPDPLLPLPRGSITTLPCAAAVMLTFASQAVRASGLICARHVICSTHPQIGRFSAAATAS